MKNILMVKFVLLIIAHLLDTFNAEFFTSVDDMKDLLETESVVIGKIAYYILEEEQRLNYLKKRVQEYIDQYDWAIENITSYIANPLNAYILTKRLSTDLQELDRIMKDPIIDVFEKYERGTLLKFPTDEDLVGSIKGIVRLQDTYNFNVTRMANGIIDGYTDQSPYLASSDCFEIGMRAYKSGFFKDSVPWLLEALERFDGLPYNHDAFITKSEILGHLAAAYSQIGNISEAILYNTQLLKQDPTNNIALTNKANLDELMMGRGDIPMINQEPYLLKEITEQHLTNSAWMQTYDIHQQSLYKKICREEITASPKQLAPLRCRYVTNKSAFLKIAPLKLEESSLDPYIVTYHDVIYDKEIETLKELGKAKLYRASVASSKEAGVNKPAEYRISKFAWMKDAEHKYVEDIGKRVQDMTGLTVSTAEELQVLNYGIGGHYEPHFDFATPVNYTNRQNERLGINNRIATVLFYMSDVEKGGATVFPFINVALWPQKGSAAFWYNLYESGEGDYRTKHAACPVFVGSKWICNKWLHVLNQEFLRPCGLKPDHPNYLYT